MNLLDYIFISIILSYGVCIVCFTRVSIAISFFFFFLHIFHHSIAACGHGVLCAATTVSTTNHAIVFFVNQNSYHSIQNRFIRWDLSVYFRQHRLSTLCTQNLYSFDLNYAITVTYSVGDWYMFVLSPIFISSLFECLETGLFRVCLN